MFKIRIGILAEHQVVSVMNIDRNSPRTYYLLHCETLGNLRVSVIGQ